MQGKVIAVDPLTPSILLFSTFSSLVVPPPSSSKEMVRCFREPRILFQHGITAYSVAEKPDMPFGCRLPFLSPSPS